MQYQIKEYDGLMDLLEDLEREGIEGFQKKKIFDRFQNFQARMRGVPQNGGFELTPLCNFDCKMCYVHLTKQQMAEETLLSTQQWIEIMSQAIDRGMIHADLTGGECLAYPGFKEIYLYLASRGVRVSVLTNGQLLTEEIADLFAKYPPAIVQITVYGSDDDAYERVTGHRAFKDVMAAVERLKKRGIKLRLTTTPSQYMQEDTHALLEMLRSLDVDYAIGTGSLPARPETGREREDYAPENDLYVKLHLDEQQYRAKQREEAGAEEMPKDMISVDYIPRGFTSGSKIPCSSGQCTFHINWKGEMTPCIPFYTIAKSVFEDGFDAAWVWIKEQMDAYEPPVECKDCKNRSVCTVCAGEKTMGVLNGPLNKDVCSRIDHYVQAGIQTPSGYADDDC